MVAASFNLQSSISPQEEHVNLGAGHGSSISLHSELYTQRPAFSTCFLLLLGESLRTYQWARSTNAQPQGAVPTSILPEAVDPPQCNITIFHRVVNFELACQVQ